MHNLQIMRSAAILGASGYAGQETLDRVLRHPALELVALGSGSLAGREIASLDPRLARREEPGARTFVTNEEALAAGADVTFLCLDSERAAAVPPPSRGVLVDLSGAHRLRDAAAYESWYGFAHPRTEELDAWSYAVPEVSPPSGRLVANPGCYATAVILALAPLKDGVDPANVVVDAKSGVTGAGRSLKASSHAGFVLENLSAYKVGGHRHAPEIERALGFPVCFVPHLLPVRRGLMATCYVRGLPADEARERLDAAYARSALVDVLPAGVPPELARVQSTDGAEIAVFADRATDHTIVLCALDNLGKGAAGQAVQNANLALDLPETMGLRLAGVAV